MAVAGVVEQEDQMAGVVGREADGRGGGEGGGLQGARWGRSNGARRAR